jgi:hypothetical protein
MNENVGYVEASRNRAISVTANSGATMSLMFDADDVGTFSDAKLELLVGHDLRSAQVGLKTLAEAIFGTSEMEPNVYGDNDVMHDLLKASRLAQTQHFQIDGERLIGRIGALSDESKDVRIVLEKLTDGAFGYAVGDEPDIYDDTVALDGLRSEVLRLMPSLDLREVEASRAPGLH